MASKSSSPDDNAAPLPSDSPNNVSAQEPGDVGVDGSTAAPLVHEVPEDGMSASTVVRALNDDGPPMPALHVVDHEKETEGPQLHDVPPGPPGFVHEFDDSLAKRVENDSKGLQLHDGLPGPPCSPHEFDDSLAKTAENEFERNLSDHRQDNASTVRSTMGGSVANSAAAGSLLVEDFEDVEEGSVSFLGTSSPVSPSTEAGAATAAVELNSPSNGYSNFIAEAWVEGGSVYEAELAEPNLVEPHSSQAILSFYQRKGFVFIMIAVTLLAIGIAVAAGALLSSNLDGNAGVTKTSSKAPNIRTPVPTTNAPTSNPTKNPASPPTRNPTHIPTNPPTWPSVLTLDSSLKLLAPDGALYDYFGWSVAIYKDTIVVGATGDDASGSAHVFVRSGDQWKHRAKLLAPDGAAYDEFGESVSIYEDTIVVGAPLDDDNGRNSGSAHVFVRSGDEWMHRAKLLAPDGAANDYFGGSVAIYEDTIVVGANGDDDNGYDSGSAHVLIRSGEEWDHQAKLLAPDGAEDDWFGRSVALYEDTIVVGATEDDDNGERRGSAHVFVQSGEEWTNQAKLLAPDGAAGDEFGESVSIYEDTTIVAGAPGDDDNKDKRGSAHVFVRSGEEWTHQAKLLAPDASAGDWFPVAIYENTIVVGAPRDDVNGDDSGSVHVYE